MTRSRFGEVLGLARALIEPTAPYQRHSQQSFEAAQQIIPTVHTLRAEVLAYLCDHGPMTDNQIIEGLGKNASSIRPRRIELVREGKVWQFGVVRQANGRKAALWTAL